MAEVLGARPETHRICNLIPSRGTENNWTAQAALRSGAVAAGPPALPASVDLRAQWWQVGDQGSTGSCVGWASTDGVARYHLVKAGKLAEVELLSPRFTWMASKETDALVSRPETMIEEAGTMLKAAADILKNYGAAPEALLPFNLTQNLYVGSEDDFFATLATRRISSYFDLKKDLNGWRRWLATHGPIMAGLNVDSTWDHASDTQGILDNFDPGSVRGGHAIAIVGYTADRRFIIRNSWGQRWGDNGFAYAHENYIAAGFFEESYGFSV